MTYAGYEKLLKESLQGLYDTGETATIADWMMEATTGYSRFLRRSIQQEVIPGEMYKKLETAKAQLLKYQPVQYVLGYTHFYGMQFFVNESVLIPRPETEELVHWIIEQNKNNEKPLRILDIGTGSGCIAVALKKKLPAATVNAVDVSAAALRVATKNAAHNQADIQFLQFDFLEETNWHQLPLYDLIVSNPPYILKLEKTTMDKNVTAWEPDIALFVPDEDPLLFYNKIATLGKIHLAKNGAIFLETHQNYAGAVQSLFAVSGYMVSPQKDINGNERMVKAVRNE